MSLVLSFQRPRAFADHPRDQERTSLFAPAPRDGITCGREGNALSGAADAAWYETGRDAIGARPRSGGMVYSSHYLTMRDGVQIAIDVYLPVGLTGGERLPVILRQTRYYRSMELRWPLRLFLGGKPFEHTGLYVKRRRRFVTHGYAWVDVDVRGSGASYGRRVCEWSPDEIRDGSEIVDWITKQPWSSGKVGALGISYDGSAAEFLLVNRHPAVKAIAPRFSLFDSYTDIAFPGGIHASWFTENWGRHNNSLDRNAPHEVGGWWVKLLVTGVQPVQADGQRALRAGAIHAHADNYDVHAEALQITHRDDVSAADVFHRGGDLELAGHPADTSGSIGLFSPHNYIADLAASGAAIYSYSGWLDGAYEHSAIKRYLTVRNPGSRLLIGPWNHGGGWNIDPLRGPTKSRFDHDGELLRFFDHHLKGIDTGIANESPVRYFTMVEDKWKASDTWPPATTTVTYYCTAQNGLTRDQPTAGTGDDAYRIDYTAATGADSRWRTQAAIDAPVKYPDRSRQDEKLLVYTSAPLDRELEVTGHPLVTLFVSSSAPDGNFLVYLEDVDQRGHVTYVTEGQLRALHRKLSDERPPYRLVVPYHSFKRKDAMPLVPGEVATLVFDLLPTSYLFQRRHCIRIALAGADTSHFAIPPGQPPTLRVFRDKLHPSHIDLPVVAGAA